MPTKQDNRFLYPYRTPEDMKPRSGYSKEGLQAREERIRKYGSLTPAELMKRDNETPFSIVYRRDYSEALKKLMAGRRDTSPTFADVARARGRAKPQYRIAEEFCPVPPPFEWKFPFPRGAAYEREIVDRIKQLHQVPMGPGTPSPDLDTAPTGLLPGSSGSLTGTYFGASAGRVIMEVAEETVVDLIVSSWTETRVDAFLDPDLRGLRPHSGRIWIVREDHRSSNALPCRFQPILSLWAVWDGICAVAGPLGFSEDLPIRSGEVLGDSDFTIRTPVTHVHDGEGHSNLVAPFAGGQLLEQGIHIGLDAGEECCAEIMYAMDGPRGVSPPAVSGLTWSLIA
jgi:hypothetical protein